MLISENLLPRVGFHFVWFPISQPGARGSPLKNNRGSPLKNNRGSPLKNNTNCVKKLLFFFMGGPLAPGYSTGIHPKRTWGVGAVHTINVSMHM